MNDEIRLSLPNKPEYVSVARMTVSVVANNMGFDIEAVEDIKLAVGEACNNAVMHSKTKSSFDIVIMTNENELKIEIKDEGQGFLKADYVEPDLVHPEESGLGIYIIKSLMDNLIIESNKNKGTKITMSKMKV